MNSINNNFTLAYNSQPDGDILSFYHDKLKIDIPIANKLSIIQEAALKKLQLNNGFLSNHINSKTSSLVKRVAFSELTENAQNELKKLVTIVETKPPTEETPDVSSIGIDITLNREGGSQ
ncbi:hypothetical protein N9N03_01875 [Chlamydiia bacterium]|nr:hypothetical protein [Chlamydiia bacterium]